MTWSELRARRLVHRTKYLPSTREVLDTGCVIHSVLVEHNVQILLSLRSP